MALLTRAVGLTVAVSLGACELVRPNDPLWLNGDIVAMQMVLKGGSSTAEVVIYYPHGPQDREPEARVQLSLDASYGWRTELVRGPCTLTAPASGVCFKSELPDSIREGQTYALRVETALDTMVGHTRIPRAPRWLRAAQDTSVLVPDSAQVTPIRLEYIASPDAARTEIAIDALVVYDRAGKRYDECQLFTDPFVGEAVREGSPLNLQVRRDLLGCAVGDWSRIEASIALLAFDSAYVRFQTASREGVLRWPWPAFGLDRGVGLLASAAHSTGTHVTLMR